MRRASSIKQPVLVAAGGIVLVVVALGGWYLLRPDVSEVPHAEITSPHIELAPMCPWREPEADLRAFFPDATTHHQEVRILSGLRLEIRRRLGRPPTPEENALYLNDVSQGSRRVGTILTRRVKGEYGGIEVVLALNADGTARGVRLQREREPEPISTAIRSPGWLGQFRGWSPNSSPNREKLLASLSPTARKTGAAIVEGVHNLLVLQDLARSRGVSLPSN